MHAQYLPNTYQYIPKYMPILACGAKTSVLNQIQYMPLHTKIHAITYQYSSAHWFSPSIQALKYWHVSLYVLVCIVQVFGMYYVMIPVNTSKYINTYQYVQYIPFFLYIQVLVNMFKYIQYIQYNTILYQYRSALSNTYQYRHIQTNTYQYTQYISLLTNSYKYRPVHTIHTNTYHTTNT